MGYGGGRCGVFCAFVNAGRFVCVRFGGMCGSWVRWREGFFGEESSEERCSQKKPLVHAGSSMRDRRPPGSRRILPSISSVVISGEILAVG